MPRARVCGFLAAAFLIQTCSSGAANESATAWLKECGAARGIVAGVGLSEEETTDLLELSQSSELTFYVQSENADAIRKLRVEAGEVGLLGVRIFADVGPQDAVQLADNVADWVVSQPSAGSEDEILRVLRPNGQAAIGDRQLTKPVPEGIDEWTHPYHGPDNNPQSSDKLAGGEFRTQFLGYPKFSPMPEQSVIAGGRIFKAMGHIAHKANQNEMLNTLLCINAYNGTILWKRSLPEGFMIHRNTMVATDDSLYMGDHESCKVFDAQSGELVDQFVVDESISDGPVWKWMAVRDGVLYAMVGNPEVKVDVQKSNRRGLGHWPWGMWEGHDYADTRYAFGFGRTLVAVDLRTKKRLWHYRDEQFLDARAVCMTGDRIFCYSPEKFLVCINAHDGSVRWKNSDGELLQAIGPNSRAQHYVTGYATTCYMKCNEDYLFFAGPQRERMVVASAADGSLAWTHPTGNLQLVLRDDAVWAAGPQHTANGFRFDYETGDVLSSFPARRACTRATGCADSIFFRASGG
ncbi:MAG: PQQ-binding-like beta-propeller repeat protein, partial [Planctomycetota bacterium]